MQSEPSQAGLVLSKNSFYSAVINPLGFYHHSGMQSCQRVVCGRRRRAQRAVRASRARVEVVGSGRASASK